jgi:hypothetical protein
MDLYNLPKDMLVKLVSEVREKAIKETEKLCKEKYEKIIREENRESSFITNCDFCESFVLFNGNLKINYTSEQNSLDDFKFCDYCGNKCYCKKHFYLFKKLYVTKLPNDRRNININKDCYYCEECCAELNL